MESLRGSLLIAGGQLLDPNFRRTVVLLAEHGEEGALGLVLNRPAGIPVEEVAAPLASFVDPGTSIYLGGPVQKDAVLILADFEDPGRCERPIVGSVGFAEPDPDPMFLDGIRRARVFSGYAGWGPGQLEAELAESAWILEPAHVEDLFAPQPERLWASVLRRKGGDYAMLSLMPYDVATN
jgi:putative transcriptional regulator